MLHQVLFLLGYYIINYHTRMATIHYQEVKTEGLLTCPLICYKYSAILSDER